MDVDALPNELLVPPRFVEADVDPGEVVVTVVDPTTNVVDDVVVDDAIDDVVGFEDPTVLAATVVVTCAGWVCAVVAGGDVEIVPYCGTGAGRTRM